MSTSNLRQIKFRVWDHRQERYLKGDGANYELCPTREECLEREQGRGVGFISLGSAIKQSALRRVAPEQFTGLKAVDGTEIYEGDIIEFAIHGATHGRYREEGIIEPVWYSEEDAQFVFGHYITPVILRGSDKPVSFDTWWYSMADEIDRASIKVLGNIHQHSHLLTKPVNL